MKNYVIWCIWVNILIRFCLKKLSFFYVKSYNSYTVVMHGYLVIVPEICFENMLQLIRFSVYFEICSFEKF